MRILFVFSQSEIVTPQYPLVSIDQMNLGISYISSVLKRSGHETRLLILGSYEGQTAIDTYLDHLQKYDPALVCFTAVCTQHFFVRKLARLTKEKFPDKYTMTGGPHPSLNPEKVIEDSFDAVCVGEGEYAVLEFVNALGRGEAPSGIPNLWIKKDGAVEKNPAREFIQDLDELPFPDWDMWLPWANSETNVACAVLLGRGCPYNCPYCCNHAFRKLATGKYVRLRSPGKIMEEIKVLVADYGMKRFHLEVETLGANRTWLDEFCALLREFNATLENPPEYATNLRITPELDYDSVLKEMASAGFTSVNIGLESGSERIRKDVLKRNYRNENIIDAVKTCKKYGIKALLFVLMGLPEETEADFRETVKVLRACQPDRYLLYVFYPYPGTDIHRMLLEKGEISDDYIDVVERIEPALELPLFSKKTMEKYRVMLDYYVYRGHRPMKWILKSVAKRKFGGNIFVRKVFNRVSAMFPSIKKLLD